MEQQQLSPARALQYAVRGYLNEHYGPLWPQRAGALPDGLRLELHPAAYQLILTDPASAHWPPLLDAGALEETFGVPVKVDAALERGTFRLVIVTEDTLLSGRL
jgi:hypothetical protein